MRLRLGNVGFFVIAAGLLLFAPSALAVCDNVDVRGSKALSTLSSCDSQPTDSGYEKCVSEKYFPLCYQIVKNQGKTAMEATDTCQPEAQACAAVLAEDRSGSTDTDIGGGSGSAGETGSGNTGSQSNASGGGAGCDTKYFENVNGICVPRSDFAQGSLAGSRDWKELITTVIRWLLMLVGVIAVVAIVIGGYWYITSAGNEETAEKGKKVLINAIIGIVLVIMAYAIVTVVTNTLIQSKVN